MTEPRTPLAEEDITWHEAAGSVRWNVRPFVDGGYRESASPELVDNINPATETVLCQVPAGAPADIHEAVRVARQRFEQGCWSGLPPVRRAEVLQKLADLLVEHQAEIALLDSLEMGKPIRAAKTDVDDAATLLRSWAGFADKLVGDTTPLSPGTLLFNTYQPRGVVGAITPWNFPVGNAIYKVGPALAAGNTVVLKPSEVAPSSALKVAELAVRAGVPEGVLNVVPGLGGAAGEALALHPDVDFVSFTGSTRIGRRIMELSGRANAKPLMLECGGKSPHVVFSDVDDLDYVASAIVQSLLKNTGQVCSAHTRLIVQQDLKDVLLDKIVAGAGAYQPGDPLDEETVLGPLASPTQRDRVKAYIDQGLKAGARAVLRGTVQESGGCFVTATIFDQVDNTMSIVRDEIFGPILCVQPFVDEEEAIALANSTDYGLGATVWTRDMGRGKRMANAISAAAVLIRTSGPEEPLYHWLLGYEPQKASGFGTELALKGLASYSTLKLVSFMGA